MSGRDENDKEDDGADKDALSPEERELALQSSPLPARVVHEVVREDGEEELARDAPQVLWSGLAAGLSMGFSFLVQAQLQALIPDENLRRLVGSLGYTVGFVIVVLGRQQLFTETTVTAVLPLLTRRDLPTLRRLLCFWALVIAANIAGTWAFAALLAYGRPFEPAMAPALARLGSKALEEGWVRAVLEAGLSGWLIALMVWLLPSARTARILVVVLITYVVALLQLPHIVAGSTEAAYAVLTGADPLSYVTRFFLPTLVGNTVGGVVFTAMLNHAPVAGEVRDED